MKFAATLIICCLVLAVTYATDDESSSSIQSIDSNPIDSIHDLLSHVSTEKLGQVYEMARSLTGLSLGPSTGAIVGCIGIAIFIIVIWIVVYSIGVTPVGGYTSHNAQAKPFLYHQRISRSLNEATLPVMNAIDKWANENKL